MIMKYSERVFRKKFTDEYSSKKAYLTACEWLAKNIVSRREKIGDFTFGIERDKNEEKPTFVLSVYVSMDEKEVNDQHCKVCKEVHKLFYVNEKDSNCNSCSMMAYRKRMHEKISVKRQYMKEVLVRKEVE